MRRHRSAYLLFLVAALAIAGCATRRDTATATSQRPAHHTSARYRYLYVEATRQKILGNHSAAFDLLQHCADIDPEAPEALFDLAMYRRALRQDSLALNDIRRAAALAPTNPRYVEALASYYLDSSNEDSALVYVERLAELQPKRTDVLSRLVGLYGASGRTADAIHALDRIELLDGKMPQVSMRKFQLYKSIDESDKAYAELDALCREFPHELNYRITIANELLADGRTEEAFRIYDEVRELDPTNNALLMSTLLYYRTTGQDSLFRLSRDSMIFEPLTPGDLRANLMRDFIREKMGDTDSTAQAHDEVIALFDSIDAIHKTDMQILSLKMGYLLTYDQDNDSAYVEVLEKMVAMQPANKEILFNLIYSHSKNQNWERLEDICRRAVVTNPEELVCYYYLGMALFQQDKREEALRAFLAGTLQKTEESRPDMVASLYSIVGDISHELGHSAEAYAAYDSCLAYQDDNAMCLNNYAYYLSLEDTLLDRAEEMSYRSLRIDPDNKTYLDTYAWILFMKQRYAEAQRYIDRVCPPDSTDSTLLNDNEISGVVLEHAGDIAAHTGNMPQALRMWQLAQQAGGKGLTATLPKKIKLKKYIK